MMNPPFEGLLGMKDFGYAGTILPPTF